MDEVKKVEGSKKKNEECFVCKEDVVGEECVACEECERWSHADCSLDKEVFEMWNKIAKDKKKMLVKVGMLIFLCDDCIVAKNKAKEEKNEKILKSVENSKKPEETVVPQLKPSKDEEVSAGQPNGEPLVRKSPDTAEIIKNFCPFYKKGKCWHGKSGKLHVNGKVCKMEHPPKCLKYCRYGWDKHQGCDGSCGLMHPTICKSSLRNRECYDPECTLSHLIGTYRHQRRSLSASQQNYGFVPNQGTDSARNPFPPRASRNHNSFSGKANYGERSTQQTLSGRFDRNSGFRSRYYNRDNGRIQQNPTDFSYQTQNVQAQGQKENFVYNQNGFPPLPSAQNDKDNQILSGITKMNSFLEFLCTKNNLSFPQNIPAVNIPQHGQAVFQSSNAKN